MTTRKWRNFKILAKLVMRVALFWND